MLTLLIRGCLTMKKSMIIALVLFMLIFVTGCVDYKAYEVPQDQDNKELELIDEIAQIEKELIGDQEAIIEEKVLEEIVEEEVILPELNEQPVKRVGVINITVKENEKLKLNVNVSDPDGDKITFSFTKPLDANGEWKTNYGDAGEYLVTVFATDGKLITQSEITIAVTRVNVPPIVNTLRDITVKEGETISLKPKVEDPNEDEITIKITEPLANGTFKTDHTSSGEYLITVVASDGELEAKESFKLIILNVNEKPIISNIADLVIEEGEVIKLEPEVTDLDGDELVVTISEPVGNDGIWETSYTDHGTYMVTVVADDGKDKVSKQIKIDIKDVNKAPVFVSITHQTE